MTRIAPLTIDQADATTAAVLKGVQAKFGMLPNLVATLARAPAALNGYLQLAQAQGGGGLSARQRELVALAVAQENACEYCLSAHAAAARGVGLTANDVDQARSGQAADANDAAIVRLALQVTRARGAVTDDDLAAARQAGVDDAAIVEVVANVAINVFTNYLNRVADTVIDFPRLAPNLVAECSAPDGRAVRGGHWSTRP